MTRAELYTIITNLPHKKGIQLRVGKRLGEFVRGEDGYLLFNVYYRKEYDLVLHYSRTEKRVMIELMEKLKE